MTNYEGGDFMDAYAVGTHLVMKTGNLEYVVIDVLPNSVIVRCLNKGMSCEVWAKTDITNMVATGVLVVK